MEETLVKYPAALCKYVAAVRLVPDELVKFKVGNIPYPVIVIFVPLAFVNDKEAIVEEGARNSDEEATPKAEIWK